MPPVHARQAAPAVAGGAGCSRWARRLPVPVVHACWPATGQRVGGILDRLIGSEVRLREPAAQARALELKLAQVYWLYTHSRQGEIPIRVLSRAWLFSPG